MSKKIIAVVGATGAQGGGLVNAILNDPSGEFAVRAITRNVSSDKAQALKKMGAEVVAGDVSDKASLVNAFKGAYGAYCVTFFWEHFSPEQELQHAKNMAEASAEADIKHVVWSTLEDTRKWVPEDDASMPTMMGKYKVPHFDAKGEANQFFVDCGSPYTLFNTSFYWDNFIYFGMGPQKGPDGNLGITFPLADKKMPGIAAEDIGKCAFGVFKAGDKYKNKSVSIAGEHLTGEQMADGFTKLLGKKVAYNAVPAEVYRGFGFPGAEDLGSMFKFKADYEDYFCGARSVEESKSLNPELLSFDAFLEKNKDKIKVD